jgi:hypothetical protein
LEQKDIGLYTYPFFAVIVIGYNILLGAWIWIGYNILKKGYVRPLLSTKHAAVCGMHNATPDIF